MTRTGTVSAAASTLAAHADALTSPVREVAAEMIASRGGIGLLVLGVLGVIVLAFDAARLLARLIARLRGGAAPSPRSRVSRSAQARALAVAGAAPIEIVQRTGLSRDALALVAAGGAEPIDEAGPDAPPAPRAAQPAPADARNVSPLLSLRRHRRGGVGVAA